MRARATLWLHLRLTVGDKECALTVAVLPGLEALLLDPAAARVKDGPLAHAVRPPFPHR